MAGAWRVRGLRMRQEWRMKRIGIVLSLMLMTMALALPALSQEAIPPHGHVKLLHADVEGFGPGTVIHSYAKCIDLAGGNELPLLSHHERVHFGTAGQKLRAAGHLIIPTSPFGPVADCAELETLIPPG
jgi:hypothetical protein